MFYVLIILIFPIFSLFPQYISYDLVPNTPESAGIASMGVGKSDRETSLIANPAFLAGKPSQTQIGIFGLTREKNSSPILPSHFGFHQVLDQNSSWGIKGNSFFHSGIRNNLGLWNFQTQIFYSYKIQDFYLGMGIGPSIAYRGIEFSPVNVSGFFSAGIEKPNWSAGISLNSAGKFQYKAFRGSDPLSERLPESLILGLSFNIFKDWKMILETKKLFYEKSYFRLSNLDERPGLDRGFGAEIKFSAGLECEWNPNWKIRTGWELAGKYNPEGQNRRSSGLGFGFSYYPNSENKGYYLSFGTMNYSILSKKGGRDPENYYFLSAGHLW